ncbi:MAG TPA: TniQ family protein [Paraburkholderia sp.]
MPDSVKPWPVAPRPFFEEAFGSWLGRVATRYQISVGMLWETSTGLELPNLGKAGWILFPPVSAVPLDRLSKLARLSDGRLAAIQTPPEWMADQRYLVYCFRCLVLNDVDVSAPRWKREWLDPEAEYCTKHRGLLETVPASIFGKAANFGDALRAISRYRTPRFPKRQRR